MCARASEPGALAAFYKSARTRGNDRCHRGQPECMFLLAVRALRALLISTHQFGVSRYNQLTSCSAAPLRCAMDEPNTCHQHAGGALKRLGLAKGDHRVAVLPEGVDLEMCHSSDCACACAKLTPACADRLLTAGGGKLVPEGQPGLFLVRFLPPQWPSSLGLGEPRANIT